MKKLAWVTSITLNTRYELVIDRTTSHGALVADFVDLNGAVFPRYRAAQDIANAINEHVRRRLAKRRHP